MRQTAHTKRRWLTKSLSACAVACGVAAMPACTSSLSELDQQVAQMIEEHQRYALGEQGVSDAGVSMPNDPSSSAGLYDTDPATYNPAAADLPASPYQDEPADPTQGPQYAEPATLEPVVLDLQGLLAYAIENAPEYRAEKESLFLATLALIIERHAWGPRFFSSVSGDISGTPESGDYDTAFDLINDFVITQRLPYGGDVSVTALVNYTNLLQQASTNTSAVQTQDTSISAALNLPLLRGAGQVARESLIQAERDLIYAARDFERFRREFFVDISNTYFGLLRQQTRIQNQEMQIEGLEALSNQQRALHAAGRIPGFEADDAEAQLLFGLSNLISVQDDYSSSLDALKLRIGMPIEQPLVIVSAGIVVPRPEIEIAEAIMIGQTARLDLQTTADRLDDARRDVLIALDQLRGDLDLDASITFNSDAGSNIGGIDLEVEDSVYRLGLTYEVPLDREIEQARYRSALIDLEQAERDYRVQQDRVALQIRDAIRDMERAALTLELQNRNVELAERRLENIRIESERGEVQPRRLIEAEQDLLDARNTRDQALADLQTSILNYLLQTGQMRVDADGLWLSPGTLLDAEAPLEDPPADTDAEPAEAE